MWHTQLTLQILKGKGQNIYITSKIEQLGFYHSSIQSLSNYHFLVFIALIHRSYLKVCLCLSIQMHM